MDTDVTLTLQSAEAIIVPHWIIWSWYNGRWWVDCYIWYSEDRHGRGRSPPRPLFAVPNVTAHPSTASVPITVLLYNGPLVSGVTPIGQGWTNARGLRGPGGPKHDSIFFYNLIFQVLGVSRLFYSTADFFVNVHFAFHHCFVFNGNFS